MRAHVHHHVRYVHGREREMRTVIVVAGRLQFGAQLIDPRLDAHEIRHERRNRALEHGRIAANHVLHQDVRSVELIDDCVCVCLFVRGSRVVPGALRQFKYHYYTKQRRLTLGYTGFGSRGKDKDHKLRQPLRVSNSNKLQF